MMPMAATGSGRPCFAAFLVCSMFGVVLGGNPLIPGVGMADPHVHVLPHPETGDLQFFMYSTHDYAANNTGFRMDNWWIWSSTDLVEWKLEDITRPEQTCLRSPYHECWATDAASNGTHYFFYLSLGPEEVGVLSSPTPLGPWRDPLGKPLLPKGLVDTQIRDPGVFADDDGSAYIVFGTFNYFIARLNSDMVSLAERPRSIDIHNPHGPYGNSTDDKPFLHKVGERYYLSWGCFYAVGDNPYGPYVYRGSILGDGAMIEVPFQSNHTQMDRHGSFFTMHNQWYFASNDYSHAPATAFFRDTVISYVHYLENGDIAPLRLDEIGVGSYDLARGVEIEDFFSLEYGHVIETKDDAQHQGGNAVGFAVCGLASGSELRYPKTSSVTTVDIIVRGSNPSSDAATVVLQSLPNNIIIGRCVIPPSQGGWVDVKCRIENDGDDQLDLSITIDSTASVCLDRLTLAKPIATETG